MYIQFKANCYNLNIPFCFKKGTVHKVIREDKNYIYIQDPLSLYSENICFSKRKDIIDIFDKKQPKLHAILCKLGVHKYCAPFMNGIHKHDKWSLVEEKEECIYCGKSK